MKFIESTHAFLEFSSEEVEEYFSKEDKCKYSWKVIKTNDIKPSKDSCFSKLQIILQNPNWEQIWISQGGFQWNECDWWDNLRQEYKYTPKTWDELLWIESKYSWSILRTWKASYDAYPEIPECQVWDLPVPEEIPSQDNTVVIWILIFSFIALLWFLLWKIIYKKKK